MTAISKTGSPILECGDRTRPDPCGWERETQPDGDDAWKTGCGNLHAFIAGSWRDNSYKFCPYCSGRIVEVGEEPAPPHAFWMGSNGLCKVCGDYSGGAQHQRPHQHTWMDIPPRRGEPNLRICGCGVEERTPRPCPHCREEIPANGTHYCGNRS
jgi:hypothetical protein